MKNLLITLTFVLTAFQGYAYPLHHRPPPPPPPRPAPYPGPYQPYPPYQPYYVTCYAQGLYNGLLFYGTGPNAYVASQWALYACQSTGQYCQLTYCQ